MKRSISACILFMLKKKAMSDRDITEMQRLIDEGIVLAQKRLVERSRLFRSTLIVTRDGKVVELLPEEL